MANPQLITSDGTDVPGMRELIAALRDSTPVSGLTHRFYRYPARFAPGFARAAIDSLTKPGDLVVDPFMGGGTGIVEALASGRRAVGLDLNPLATFITRSKTTPLSSVQCERVLKRLGKLSKASNLRKRTVRHDDWEDYQRNVPWWLRKTLEIALDLVATLASRDERRFSRAVLLRTAQWALDTRPEIPTKERFLIELDRYANQMAQALRLYSERVAASFGQSAFPAVSSNRRLVTRAVTSLGTNISVIPEDWGSPSLILTSPPYWGVHILYHRWQIQSRRETPAPYWLAGCEDGQGPGFYTFGNRNRQNTDEMYLSNAELAFRAIKRTMGEKTLLLQLVGFSEARRQRARYSEMLSSIGLEEVVIDKKTGPLFRRVPNRKWYHRTTERSTGREFLLMHRVAS